MPVPSPHRPRARADGREAQPKPHTQPTAGGRTLVDADRIKAARIGDPLGVDLTERACRPLIRLSTHPTAAARAARVSHRAPVNDYRQWSAALPS
ncbi:hypothetical protein EVAR_28528_1 [Eumeta japonica]|uniref:Uncharacterized protein n=1 Tax=Eumeta variegata TaxID=151549 RepID=A0A4C1UY63_EUMVA|nr:hypothetical protein EVAR_28528_1 [Eumeta japonica]